MKKLPDILSEPLSAEQFHARVQERMGQRDLRRGYTMAQRAAFLRDRAPDQVRKTLAEAELALRGLLVLPGTGDKPLFVGDPPQWAANPTGDEEYLWGLNRMFHWTTLLRAYSLTGQSRYARKVVAELSDWIERCPRPPVGPDRAAAAGNFCRVDPWRSLEAGIRMYETWPRVLEHLSGTPFLTPELLGRMAVSMHEHAEVLAEICPIFWPHADHNHYLMENLGLLSVAVLLPDLADCGRWLDQALAQLERCAAAQLTAGGGQIEGCPHYHDGCVYWFCLAIELAGQAGRELSPAYRARLGRALEYTVHTLRPSGGCVPWGDSDATDNATAPAIWWYKTTGDAGPLHMTARLTGPEAARRVALELAWVVPDVDALLRALDPAERHAPSLPLVSWQKELRQVALRTGWDREALSVFYACRSPVNNTHAHIDPAGFDFTALGRALLVDPGRYTYRNGPERRDFKSAAWHNTLTVNGREPFAYLSSWAYGPQQEGCLSNVWQQPQLLAAEAVQHNFAPAVHRRLVAIVADRVLLVLDELGDLAPGATVQVYFHFDSTAVRWDQSRLSASADFGDVDLALHAAASTALTGTLLPGQVSEHIDDRHDSLRLRLEDAPGTAPVRRYAALVMPHRQDAPRPALTGPVLATDGGATTCRFTLDGQAFRLVWHPEQRVELSTR
jgi:hypothetical protein